MGRFNPLRTGSSKTTNYEGDVAYKLPPDLELYSAVCTASLQSKFYEPSAKIAIDRIRELIKQNSPEFVAKLAVYTREEMHLRSVPLVLTVELARIHNGDKLVSKLTQRVIQRADEITELLAYYQESNERKDTKKLNKLSKQLSIGIANSFHKFDEYSLQKYNRDGAVKLRDALFLTHPKPISEEEVTLFKKLTDDSLATPYTWETELSALGSQSFTDEATKALAFKNKWEELIDSNKLGYMATMRNLRNILKADVSLQHLQKVCSYLSNEKAVANSKQFPFRYLAAYRELTGEGTNRYYEVSKSPSYNPYTSMVINSLEDAIKISADKNIAGYDYDTTVLIACDTSGSMETAISPKSTLHYYEIGLVLGMLLQNKCKSVITGIFGERWKVKNLPQNSILQNVKSLYSYNGEVGHSTNGYLAIQWLLDNNVKIDKLMMFTDCQLWDSNQDWSSEPGKLIKLWNEYTKTINPDAKFYLFDLAGYGNTPISTTQKNVYLIAGWSDKIFEMLDAIEHGDSAINFINSKITL
ncbi:MAG: TROVE domain-containing protein [Gammaproteobacteria bacterium]|nr:TROVE domain-containing protein [Gammaproteobacteria bacterium]